MKKTMTSHALKFKAAHLLKLSWLCLLPLSACNCEDEKDPNGFSLDGDLPDESKDVRPDAMGDETPDAIVDEASDVALDVAEDEVPDEIADEAADEFTDMGPVVLPPPEPWEPEVVVEVPRSQAFNDRTSLSVGNDNTVWLGFHSCDTNSCNAPDLTIANRAAAATNQPWSLEDIAPQNTTFGLDVYENTPIVAFLDTNNSRFRVAQRSGPNSWNAETLPVQYGGNSDGLDLTHDGANMYVTFASDSGAPVNLFAKAMKSQAPAWIKLRSLDVGKAQAALERGLQADGNGNLFLVHKDGDFGPYGVARYSLMNNTWNRRQYLSSDDLLVSSMVARSNGDICMSSASWDQNEKLTMTCGTISGLERDVYGLNNERTNSYSSLIEGKDGSLMIAYAYGDNERLKIARRFPNGQWDVRTVFDGPTYGVSTAIDKDNKLLISYYTCRSSRCTLEFIRQPY